MTLRPPVADTSSWTLVLFDGGLRGGEVVLMFAGPNEVRRVLATLAAAPLLRREA